MEDEIIENAETIEVVDTNVVEIVQPSNVTEPTGTEEVLSSTIDFRLGSMQNEVDACKKDVLNMVESMQNLMGRINIVEDTTDNLVKPIDLTDTLNRLGG